MTDSPSNVSDDLRPLNRAYRFAIGVAFVMVVTLLAVVTAAPTTPGAEGELAGGAPAPGATPGGPPGDLLAGASGTGGSSPADSSGGGSPSSRTGGADTASGGASANQSAGSPQEAAAGGGDAAQPGGNSPAGGNSREDGQGGSSSGANAQGRTPAGPSDQGVSANTIKIAFTRINPSQAKQYGVDDPHQAEAINAYVDYVNGQGGINGRAIEPIIITQDDARYEEDGQQTCRTAFVEHKAFMMINDNRWPGIVECAIRLGRPISDLGQGIVGATTSDFLTQAGGRYWTVSMDADRIAALWVDYVAKNLGRQKVGIIEHYNAQMISASQAVQRALAKAGFPKPSVFRHTEDVSTAAIQASNMASQFQRDGVTLVMPVTTAIAVGLAQRGFSSRGYQPKWTFSPLGQLDGTDYAHLYDNRQFNGSTGITFARLPEQSGQASCRNIFKKRYPDLEYGTTQSVWCHLILLNTEVLRRAGQQLTLQTWAQAFSSVSAYKGNHTPVSSYGARKFDGADRVQVLSYRDGKMTSQSGFVRRF